MGSTRTGLSMNNGKKRKRDTEEQKTNQTRTTLRTHEAGDA